MQKRGTITKSGITKICIAFGFLFFLLTVIVFATPGGTFVIEGDTVYIEDSNLYLSATPHTITQNGWVEHVLISKRYGGQIDLAIGVDTDDLRPRKVQLYDPKNLTEEVCYTCEGDFNYTVVPKHFWCYDPNGTLVFEHDFDTGILALATACWDETTQQTWRTIDDLFTPVNYNYDGKNKWWLAKNLPINEDQEYKFRVYYQIPYNGFNPKPMTAKYDLAIKPSSETISEAIAAGHFYLLDPFVNSSGQSHGSLDDGLLHYWNFNSTGNASSVEDLFGVNSSEQKNLTIQSGHSFRNSSLNDGAVYCAGSVACLNATTYNGADPNGTGPFTVSLWINFTSGTPGQTAFVSNDKLAHSSWNPQLWVMDTNFANVQMYTGAGGNMVDGTSKVPETTSTWVHIVGVRNSSHHLIYVNGTLIGTDTDPIDIHSKELIFGGNGHNGAANLVGEMDEIGIWNRSLSPEEVESLYNNYDGLFYAPGSEAAASDSVPNVTWTEGQPANGTNSSDYIWWRCNATDDYHLLNLTRFRDSSPDAVTLNNTYPDTFISISSSLSTSQGSYDMHCTAYDNNSQSNSTPVRRYHLDKTAPNVTIRYPLADNYSVTSVNFNITPLDNWVLTANCSFSLDTFATNTSMVALGSHYNYTNTSIGEGTYTASFTCQDKLSLVNATESVTFLLDTTPPAITHTNYSHEVNTSFSQTYTVTDAGVQVFRYILNDTSDFNITQAGLLTNVTPLNTTTVYYLNLSANDSLGNLASTVFMINVTNATEGTSEETAGGGGGAPLEEEEEVKKDFWPDIVGLIVKYPWYAFAIVAVLFIGLPILNYRKSRRS